MTPRRNASRPYQSPYQPVIAPRYPVAGTFGDAPPNLNRPYPPNAGPQQPPARYPHPQQQQVNFPQQHLVQSSQSPSQSQVQARPQHVPAPLIPMDAVEALHEPTTFTDGAYQGFQDPFNAAFVGSEAGVFEGYIPAPGRKDDTEDVRKELNEISFDSSDDEEDRRLRQIREIHDDLEEAEQLRRLDEDDSELDADYSEEDAEQDAGDPEEMELLEELDDEYERPRSKRGRPGKRGMVNLRGQFNIRGAAQAVIRSATRGRGQRGGRRGRPSSRGRGGFHGSSSTRGKKYAKRGRGRGGKRGPRAVADPGPEFKELQRHANDNFIAGRYEEALSFAQKAIQLNPEIFDAYNVASEIYAAMGQDEKSIDALIAGAPTKRDPALWRTIIERIQKIDPEKFPEYTEDAKTIAIHACLNQIIALDDNYEARSHKLEIEAQLGRASKCVGLGLKMLKSRQDAQEDPDTQVLKTMAIMGTSSRRQTRLHLDKLLQTFEEAVRVFTAPGRDPTMNEWDWEMINIYLDLLDRKCDYERGVVQTKILSRWKQLRAHETFWNDEEDDREFDVHDEPRRVHVPMFQRAITDAKHGEKLPLEIRVKLGLFRLRRHADDFPEAMHHLEMLRPDVRGPDSLVWDYEDLFRIIADALHATGHDKDALRFYEPLLSMDSAELNLMSYLGLHTCYKNEGQQAKADEIIPILQEWPAESYDDLAILAKFFEDNGLWRDAMLRAEAIYRDKYGHKLKDLNFQAYDELRAYYYQERRKARGNHTRKKSAAKKKQRMLKKATTQDSEDDSAYEGAHKELAVISENAERPKQGLFRTKRAKTQKLQTFLPVLDEPSDTPLENPVSRRTTIEGTDVPLKAVDQRLFRRKLENLASNHADELSAARAQHREIVSSFRRLEELADAAEEDNTQAISEILSITRELIEEFSTFDLFYVSKKEDLKTYFRRIGNGEIWKESALMVLAVVANKVEDGEVDSEMFERPKHAPQDFWGVHFDKWCDAFGQYAVLLARTGNYEQCFATLDIVTQSNIFSRTQTYHQQLQLSRLVCALTVDDSNQASAAARYLLKAFPFGTDIFRLYSAINRLCSFPEGYSTGPTQKVLMRYIKTMDYALLDPPDRAWYNFRTKGGNKSGLTINFNSGEVDRVVDHDPALFALHGHVLMCGGSYVGALNYYFRAYAVSPDDPVINLSIGVAYIQHGMKRLSENRQYQIQQGLSFLYRYYELRTSNGSAIHKQEAEFNVARMWHALGLMSLAVPAYERCIALRGDVQKEAHDDCESVGWAHEDFATEAAFSLQNIFSVGGNFLAARKVTEELLVLE